jgi:hypothetical protein
MSDEKPLPTYKVTITGPGHSFEKEVDELIAAKLITFAITGKVEAASGTGGGKSSGGGDETTGAASRPAIKGSLAGHIKAKKADKNQVLRFLATAQWLTSRDEDALLTSGAVAKALADHNQRRLANPADCLNKNVAKGFCEKRKAKDGSFFITPEGLEALDGAAAE